MKCQNNKDSAITKFVLQLGRFELYLPLAVALPIQRHYIQPVINGSNET